MLHLSKIAPDSESHEEVFLGRYARLRAWALQLTENDRERAEDLVHDAYVQFKVSRPDLNAIGNIDGYLYTILRNLHLSQVRRSLRVQHRTLSIVDYDSAEIGLRGADPRQQSRLQDELRLVCQYACMRKETSKAGSVLILRFLHGYYPREIAQVMRSTRPAVEERLRTARSEARQYLKDPNSLHFMRQGALDKIQVAPMGFARTTDELLNELRQTIFNSRHGICLASTDLKKLYIGDDVSGLDHVTLGHVTSCPRCLDEVNRLLDLPLLIERFPTDTIGTDKGAKGGGGRIGGSGGGTPGGASERELRRCRKRAKDVFEHRPNELCVSVNGYLIAAQNVGSELSEQTLSINVAEKIDFIEIFGEQDLRLLFLSVEEQPPDGAYRRSVRVDLSDERTLEATLSFTNPWPTLQVLYSDPLTSAEVATPTGEARAAVTKTERAQLTNTTRPDRGAEKEQGQAGLPNVLVRVWHSLANGLGNSGFRLRPATVTAVLSLVLIAALLVVRLHVPTVSAAELLQRSIVAEQTIAANPEVVLHRTINLEERRLDPGKGTGNVIARQRIETWQSAARGIKLRRIYDEDNQLIAGEWSKTDGTSIVYRRGMKPQARTSPDVAARAILDTGELWRLDASARDFEALIGGVEMIAVEERPDAYVLTYQSAVLTGGGKLMRATLTLSKTDLHAIEQTLMVQGDGEAREFRFVEAGFGQNSAGSIAPGLFQPEPELLGTRDGAKNGSTRTPAVDDLPPTETTAPSSEVSASRELEIEVTYLLDRIKANLGEQVSMARTAGGSLRVEALVETEGRKAEILRALSPLISNPAVKIEVRTVAEAVKREKKDSKPGDITIRDVDIANSRIPADLELRTYFSARLVGNDAIDQEISRYAGRVMGHSRQALLQGSALKRLVERFSPEEMSALSPEARAKWLAMIHDHALSYRREVAALRNELRPIFYRAGEAAVDEDSQANPARLAERLVQLSYANDDAVRSAFTISADGRTTSAIKSEQFWRSLMTAEKLAAAIQSTYQK
jgi:RNA polymerase sigma factor (sigma-70 family)